MIDANRVRRISVKTSTGWLDTHMERLEPGDVIRLYEPDGRLVASPNGDTEQTVTRHPAIDVRAGDGEQGIAPTAFAPAPVAGIDPVDAGSGA